MPDPIQDIVDQLDALDGREVTVTVNERSVAPNDAAEADRIHALLLQKQRGGSLGLND